MIVLIIAIVLLFVLLHELGHIIAAACLGLRIDRVGITLIPVPHFYVAVSGIKNDVQDKIFLFSGFFTTIIVFTILYFGGWWHVRIIYYAIGIQLAIEVNPFLSDFTIACEHLKKYSWQWYLFFVGWVILIYLFFGKLSTFFI